MSINADRPYLWKADVAASVDLYNDWFMRFGPKAYRETRVKTTEHVQEAIRITNDLVLLDRQVLRDHPAVLPVLRMSTAPPIARERLAGLAYVNKHLIHIMEEEGKLPSRMNEKVLDKQLQAIAGILSELLDDDIFPCLKRKTTPTQMERYRASTIVADRLCGAMSDPIIRNAQEKRQLTRIDRCLRQRGYKPASHKPGMTFTDMPPGSFALHMNVVAGAERKANIPIDVIVQPHRPDPSGLPILIEAKSAGDFTNTNKRRKEEATNCESALRPTPLSRTRNEAVSSGKDPSGCRAETERPVRPVLLLPSAGSSLAGR
jgi:hypothetical protein